MIYKNISRITETYNTALADNTYIDRVKAAQDAAYAEALAIACEAHGITKWIDATPAQRNAAHDAAKILVKLGGAA